MAQVALSAGMATADMRSSELEEAQAAETRCLLLACFVVALAPALLPRAPLLLRSATMRTSSSPSYSTSLSSLLLAEEDRPLLSAYEASEAAECERYEPEREGEGDEQQQSALAQHEAAEPLEYQLPVDDDGDSGDDEPAELSDSGGEAERGLRGRRPVDTAGLSRVLRGRDEGAVGAVGVSVKAVCSCDGGCGCGCRLRAAMEEEQARKGEERATAASRDEMGKAAE